jgi:hypothetical protein
MTITNLNDLHEFFSSLPEGTTASGIASDLEAGNIDSFSVEKPDGTVIEVQYVGPVAEGYVSPFETQYEWLIFEESEIDAARAKVAEGHPFVRIATTCDDCGGPVQASVAHFDARAVEPIVHSENFHEAFDR